MEDSILKKFGPVKAEEELLSAAVNYCEKTFPVSKSAPGGDESDGGMRLQSKMRTFLRGSGNGQARLMGEQYVERIVPYAMSKTPIGEIGLQDETALAFARYLAGPEAMVKPDESNPNGVVVKLYEHQEKSFKILNSEDPVIRKQHLVVCSGTGSGKTESFLIPLIDAIVKERKEKGSDYKPGVRALILYPMNALVNDQLRRLKAIISEIDDAAVRPSFGRYTGELKRESELDAYDESLDEMNIGEARAKDILDSIDEKLNCGSVPERQTLKLKGIDERISQQYQTRKQWADAPADILVTNYAMLERLLLRPDACGLFNTEQDGKTTWKFIALDEAHSYTGGQGTEIAWLIRRLVGRLANPEDIRFLATSATLRSKRDGETDADLSSWIAENFAARIFPAKASDFYIEPGRPYTPAEMLGKKGDCYSGRILCSKGDGENVLLDEVGAKLFDETAELLMRDKNLSEAIDVFKPLLGDNPLPDTFKASEIDLIVRLLKFDLSKINESLVGWDLDSSDFQAVKVTDEMKRAVRWLKDTMIKNGFCWKRYLTDPLTRRGSFADTIENQWNDASAREWSGAAFAAFYRAIGDMVDASTPYCDDGDKVSRLFQHVQAFEVRPSGTLIKVLSDYKEWVKEEKSKIEKIQSDLLKRWSQKTGIELMDGDNIEKFLFKVIGGREDVASICADLDGKMVAVKSLCEKNNIPKEELFALLQLAMMARKPGMRSPALDVRYHQMIRGAFDVGVYFGNNNLNSVEFWRSDENTCDDNRSLFSLGVCRDCGQLFLIGYTDNSDLSSPRVLVRNKSSSFGCFHAFAWYQGRDDHADLLNNEQCSPDDGAAICYLNLNNGLVVNKAGYEGLAPEDKDGCIQMIWHRAASSRSFVQVCPNCGKHGSSLGSPEYGIITPYSASDIQFKTEVLEEFVKGAIPDSNPAVFHRPGRGRKVLTFADSRARAAEIPSKFDENFNRKFFDDRIHEIVKGKPIPDAAAQNALSQILTTFGLSLNDLSHEANMMIQDASVWKVGNIAQALMEELQKNNLDDMLSIHAIGSNQLGKPLDLHEAAKCRVVHAIHDSSRTGLLRGERVSIESRYIKGNAYNYFSNNVTCQIWGDGQREKFLGNIEPLLQKLYGIIFVRTRMTVKLSDLDEVWEPAEGFSKYLCRRMPNAQGGRVIPDYELITASKYKKVCKKFCSEKLGIELSDELCVVVLETFYQFLCEPQGQGVSAALVSVNAGDLARKALSIKFLCDDLIVKFNKEPEQGFRYENAERIRVEEHTAQLSSRQGRLYQQGFADGRINVLSCSTTFEMGIDVGALTRVLMLNTPPGTANYKQRAGRAGRRPGACAYIVTMADSDTVSQAYFEKPLEIFEGEIDAPSIYIEKKSFWSRHFRAEAMHEFLCWWQETNNAQERSWNSFKAFYINSGTNKKPLPPVCDFIKEWLTSDGNSHSPATVSKRCKALLNASGIPEDRLDYVVANDLAFQVVGINDAFDPPYEMSVDNYFRFQELSGPFMPAKSINGQSLVDEEGNVFRCCAKKRAAVALAGDLNHDAISSFAKYNVIPKYGFPVDVIPLKLDSDDRDVELSYDLKIGLYSYAPGRVVYANKRRIQSTDRFETLERGDEVVENVFMCPSCGTVEWVGNVIGGNNERKCVACGRNMESVKAVRPKKFKGREVGLVHQVQQGQRQQIYSGGLRDAHIIPGLSLYVSEPDTRMMRFFNLGVIKRGRDDKYEFGFKAGQLNNQKVILYHEVITDMTLWTLPPVDTFEDANRVRNAYWSAAFALKKAIVKVLHLAERDIGVVVREGISSNTPMPNGYRWTVIFYDLAQGGGGAILPIVRPAVGHEEKIKAIVDEAISLCGQTECCLANSDNENPEDKPVNRSEWINNLRTGQNAGCREAHACKRCLIGVDNRFESGLDRLDALAVLKKIIEPSQGGSTTGIESPASVSPAQDQATLVQILDALIAHPNRNATDVDKKFIQDFKVEIGDSPMKAAVRERSFDGGGRKVKSLLCWEGIKVAIFSSSKANDVDIIKSSYEDWEFIVVSDTIDVATLKSKFMEV